MTSPAAPWTIEGEAWQAFELANRYCTDCRDYHMTRAFLKAAGIERGPARDRAVFAPMLRRHARPGSRVLIAGAADTGLLDFTLSAVGDLDPTITVVDKCPTPLVLCTRFAAAQGVAITTMTADLTSDTLGSADLIVGHLVLNFVPLERRTEVLAHLGGMLAPGGVLVMALQSASRSPRPTFEGIMQGLTDNRVTLPGDGSAVTEALRRFAEMPRRPRSGELVESLFAAAGFALIERQEAPQRPRADGQPRPPRPYFALRRKSLSQHQAGIRGTLASSDIV